MPVEIKELHIKMTISDNSENEQTANIGNAGQPSSGQGNMDKNELVKECVEQVLDILKNKLER